MSLFGSLLIDLVMLIDNYSSMNDSEICITRWYQRFFLPSSFSLLCPLFAAKENLWDQGRLLLAALWENRAFPEQLLFFISFHNVVDWNLILLL